MSVLRREKEKKSKKPKRENFESVETERNGTEVVGQKTDNGLVRRGGLGGIRNI